MESKSHTSIDTLLLRFVRSHAKGVTTETTHYCLIGVKSEERDYGDRDARSWEARAADRYGQIVKAGSATNNLM